MWAEGSDLNYIGNIRVDRPGLLSPGITKVPTEPSEPSSRASSDPFSDSQSPTGSLAALLLLRHIDDFLWPGE